MTAPLTPAERKRLAKLLGLLGSDFSGEVLSAAKHAHELVQSNGLTWDEINGESQASPTREESQLTGWRLTVVECLRHADGVSDWEFSFLSSLSARSRPLSPKQRAILDGIADRILDA